MVTTGVYPEPNAAPGRAIARMADLERQSIGVQIYRIEADDLYKMLGGSKLLRSRCSESLDRNGFRMRSICRRGDVAPCFFATFPIAVHYGREIRMYPLLSVFFLTSFLCFIRLWEIARGANDFIATSTLSARAMWPLLGFSLSLALSFYTHYTAALYFILYGLVSVIFLLTREKILFLWIFFGLLFSTVLVLPQLYHLFTSSLGDPDKDWMQPRRRACFIA